MFMTAWVFKARHCPTLLNEIKKTKLDDNTEPQAGINILLASAAYVQLKWSNNVRNLKAIPLIVDLLHSVDS